jgi:hypothetical protein
MMNRSRLIEIVEKSPIRQEWHFFGYHFQTAGTMAEHALARGILDALIEIEAKLQGFAAEYIGRIAAINGRPNEKRDYEQLMQLLAELVILRRVVGFDWPSTPTFSYEPVTGSSRKNPEITVAYDTRLIGFEVKSPALSEHRQRRGTNMLHLPARGRMRETDVISEAGDKVTLPRDNPVKDFLLSAESKFNAFKKLDGFHSVLVVVWDDHIYEPIGSLLHPESGLFTANSFFKEDGMARRFENIDSVIITSHRFGLGAAAALDYPGATAADDPLKFGTGMPNAYIKAPQGNDAPEEVLRCMDAAVPDSRLGAEMTSPDLIIWMQSRPR